MKRKLAISLASLLAVASCGQSLHSESAPTTTVNLRVTKASVPFEIGGIRGLLLAPPLATDVPNTTPEGILAGRRAAGLSEPVDAGPSAVILGRLTDHSASQVPPEDMIPGVTPGEGIQPPVSNLLVWAFRYDKLPASYLIRGPADAPPAELSQRDCQFYVFYDARNSDFAGAVGGC